MGQQPSMSSAMGIARGLLRQSADATSLLRLLLAAGCARGPRTRRVLYPALRAMAEGALVEFRYRQHGRILRGSVRLDQVAGDLQAFLEIVVRDCYRVPQGFEPDTVIDGGANVGFFSMAARARWPAAKVVAIEPHPQNAERLEAHLATNGLAATVLRAGLASRAGEARFFVRDALRGSLAGRAGPEARTIHIRTCRLGDVYAEHVRGRCLVKLDIEGAEIEVLREFLDRPRMSCAIVGELHHWRETGGELERLFSSAGFTLELYDEDPVCQLFTAYCP